MQFHVSHGDDRCMLDAAEGRKNRAGIPILWQFGQTKCGGKMEQHDESVCVFFRLAAHAQIQIQMQIEV